MKFNERIKTIMKDQGLTQKELATRANITEASMSKYLSGERTPRIDVVVNLANALNVTVDDLIGDGIENNKNGLSFLKAALARGMETMSHEEQKKLLLFLIQRMEDK